jgi:hypothetical protein
MVADHQGRWHQAAVKASFIAAGSGSFSRSWTLRDGRSFSRAYN